MSRSCHVQLQDGKSAEKGFPGTINHSVFKLNTHQKTENVRIAECATKWGWAGQ